MIEELTAHLDQEVLDKILLRFAGTNLYIPYEPNLSHPLSHVLSDREFLQVCEEFGGQTISLPSSRSWLKGVQRRKIHQLKLKSLSNRQIALQVGCTERWVRLVLEKYPLGSMGAHQ